MEAVEYIKEKNVAQESFRDRIATVDKSGKRKWVFAQKPKGRFYNLRSYLSWLLLLIFAGLPFIYVNGRPLFLFNIPEAKFILFGKVFWPQDFFIFGMAMIAFIVFIILFTSAFGRLFCGWVCPQTIFMEMVFRKIEYLVEGDAAEQKLLAKAPWNGRKIRKKLSKHVIFYLISFVIANIFLSYIIGVKELGAIISQPVSQHIGGFLSLVVFSGIFYYVFAFFREQVCTVVCPYGRLQGVLLDRNSMVVAYDHKRGEPRGKFKKTVSNDLGDCLDCFQCVKVCPTGIDIRNGTQMDCIGCTACIDACDHMMEKTGRLKGLIRYASENGISEGKPLKYTTRMRMYSLLSVLLLGILTFLLISRKDVDVTIMRTPGMLYQERGTDSVSNLYNIKVVNKTIKAVPLTLTLEGVTGKLDIVGSKTINVKEEGQGTGSFFIVLPGKNIAERKTRLQVGIYEGNEKIDVIKTNFLGPVNDE
jgi:cytochrome c oxidase accessory protein FixG